MANLNEQVKQQKKEIENLKQTIGEMQRAKGVSFIRSLEERLNFNLEGNVDSTVTNQSAEVDEGGGAVFDVAKQYDRKARITVDGDDYYIGLYNV